MQPLSLPNNDRPQGLKIIPVLLPSLKKKRPPPQPKITFASKSPRYTLNELVHLPDEELHCYLKSVESSCMLGDDIDSDLHLIRRAQELFRRMDSQYEAWMNAVRAELDALFENLENMRDRIRGEIRDCIERNCRGAIESNITQKRACEKERDDVKNQHREKPGLRALVKSIWETRATAREIANLDEEFPLETKHGIRIATQGTHVDVDDFDFLPGSHGSEIERYIAQANAKLNELDRQQEENGRRVQALIRCEGFCYGYYAGEDWPLPDPRF